MSGSKPKSEHPDIVLNSPVGKEPAIYKWPLLYTSAGNKIDGAVEIIDTIRWVANEFPQIQAAIENVLMTHSDYRSYETIRLICDKYNKIVDTTLKLFAGSSLTPGRSNKPSVGLVKHVIQQVYNYAVTDPDKLNQYQPFSSGVYGETSFEFISQMIEEINLTDQDIFIDLGSGVGQVVLQIAALTPCKLCLGIEKADVPAGYAETMSTRFKFWMAWHGKTYNEFQLIKGDFFDRTYEETVKNATFIFVNNFAFGPEVDHELKRRFIDLRDGTKIISSKRFCAPKTKVTERNLTDIGSIMNVREIQPEQKKDTVSWTDRPVSYYLHIIDGSRVERYYERLKRQQQRSVKKGKKVRRRKGSSESLSNESDDGTFYGPTTRKAWSEWCNATAHTSSSETPKTAHSNHANNNSSNITTNNNNRSENVEVDVLPKPPKKEEEIAKVVYEKVTEKSPVKPELLPCVPIEVEEVHELPTPQLTILSTDEAPKEDNSMPAKQSKLKLKLKLSLSKTGISIKKETPPKVAKASSKKKNAAAAAVLNLLHNKTVESVAGPSGYYPQPAQGCIEQKLDSYQEAGSMPDVVIRDISQWMPSGGFDKLVKDLKKSVKAFLTYMQSNEYKESICRKISEEQEKNRRLIKNDQELTKHVEHLSERLLGAVTKHCNELKVNPKEQDYGLKLYLSNFANLNMMSVSLVNEIDNLTNVNKMLQSRQAPKPGEPPAAHSRDININNNNRFIPPRAPNTTPKSKATASLASHTNHAGSLKILDLSKNSNAVIKSPWIKL